MQKESGTNFTTSIDMANHKANNIEKLSLKQQEAIEWLEKNGNFLNKLELERSIGVYPQSIHKWLKKERGLSLDVAQKVADWVISFRA